MALSPDAIVEVSPCPPPDTRDDIVKLVENFFFPPSIPHATPLAVCSDHTNLHPNGSVFTIGLWVDADGFGDDQRRDALVASSFISGDWTASLFITKAIIQLKGELSWAATDKHQGRMTLNDAINIDVSSAGIVTKVSGTFEVPVLPDISFTYTTTEPLTLNPPGTIPALQAQTKSNLDVSQGGIIADAILTAIISPILGSIVFFGEEIVVGGEKPQDAGVGTGLANSWPTVILTSKPIVGKVTFTWTDLIVDENGVRTQGTFQLGPRSPQVGISGPAAVSFPVENPGAVETYSVQLTDLRPENAQVVWSGEAEGIGMATRVSFDRAGAFSIAASVTDTDGVSAAGQKRVTVTVTDRGNGHGHPP